MKKIIVLSVFVFILCIIIGVLLDTLLHQLDMLIKVLIMAFGTFIFVLGYGYFTKLKLK
jgi:hypothetical protein